MLVSLCTVGFRCSNGSHQVLTKVSLPLTLLSLGKSILRNSLSWLQDRPSPVRKSPCPSPRNHDNILIASQLSCWGLESLPLNGCQGWDDCQTWRWRKQLMKNNLKRLEALPHLLKIRNKFPGRHLLLYQSERQHPYINRVIGEFIQKVAWTNSVTLFILVCHQAPAPS